MWIQLLLIIGILFALVRFIGNSNSNRTKAWKKIMGIVFTLFAINIVLFPELANDMAHWVGVSRGADLLLYLLTLAFIFTSINQYVHAQEDQKRLVSLTRKVALLEAERNRKIKR